MGGIVLMSVTGCGAGSAGNTTSTGAANSSGAASMNHRVGQRGAFQPNFTMTTNPSSVSAGKAFTMTFAMQRPNSGANHPNGGANRGGSSEHHVGNWAGSQGGNGQAPAQPEGIVQITGNGVNETIHLTDERGSFTGQATLAKAGTYQAAFSMTMGSRQFHKDFTIQVH